MLKQMNRLKLSSKFSFFALHHLERFSRSGIFIFNKKMNDMWETKEINTSHIAEWATAYMTRHGFDSCAKRSFFFVLLHYFILFFVKSFLLILRTILSRSQSAKELMNYANYEYVIFTLKECISQNLFEIMCG